MQPAAVNWFLGWSGLRGGDGGAGQWTVRCLRLCAFVSFLIDGVPCHRSPGVQPYAMRGAAAGSVQALASDWCVAPPVPAHSAAIQALWC